MVQIGAWNGKWYDNMKYIITETQYNTIVESNKRIEVFQELINKEIVLLREYCGYDPETGDYEDSSEDFDLCNEVSTVEDITITNIELIKSEQNPKIVIEINIMYDFMSYKNYDDLVYQLKYILKKSTGLPIDIKYETVNTRTNPQW
jgi:hypothetical protein